MNNLQEFFSTKPVVSVVVPVRNDLRVFDLLAVLSTQVDVASVELIIACNGAEPVFLDRLRDACSFTKSARILSIDEASPARALNKGIGAARGCYILILDSDCIPSKNFLLTVARDYRGKAAVRGRVLFTGTTAFSRLTAKYRSAVYAGVERRGLLYTPNLLVSRDVFLRIGGFDESIRYSYDSEFSDRARRSGITAELVPSMSVEHRCHTRLQAEIKIWFHYGVGRSVRFSSRRRKRTVKGLFEMVFGDVPWAFAFSRIDCLVFTIAYWIVRASGLIWGGIVPCKR
jgi:GT2 family glycosyltransferase